MANRNPSPATRFSANRPGRAKQRGARDRLSANFIEAMAADFEANGGEAIRTVRTNDPSAYLRVVASLMPKEVDISRTIDEIDDEILGQLIEDLRRRIGETPGSEVSGTATKKAIH